MAFENDFDPEDDFQFIGNRSINIHGKLRSVVVNSKNTGSIEAKKKNAGGITGNVSLGLIKNCINVGSVGSEESDYVGGIAGTSVGYLRNNYVKSELTGHNYVGGIAGFGQIVTDNKAIVKINDGVEKIGTILGSLDQDNEENEIKHNAYLTLTTKLGAIDKIDYSDIAEPLTKEQFTAIENLPDEIKNTTITFENEGKILDTITVPIGEKIDEQDLPKIPSKEGYTSDWNDFKKENNNLMFDKTYQPNYLAYSKTLVSNQSINEKPEIILAGEFKGIENFNFRNSSAKNLPITEEQKIIKSYILPELKGNTINEIRVLSPNYKTKDLKIYVRNGDTWENTNFEKDGSYLKIAVENNIEEFAIVYSHFNVVPLVIIAILGIAWFGYSKCKNKKISKKED